MSSSRQWVLTFVCKEEGHDRNLAKKAVQLLVERGARYNLESGYYRYHDSSGEKIYYNEKENGDPDGSKLAAALEKVTENPGGQIAVQYPFDPDIPFEKKQSNWDLVNIAFHPMYPALDGLEVKNFSFAYEFRDYLKSDYVRLEVEREIAEEDNNEHDKRILREWEEAANKRIPKLVELCEYVYEQLHPYLVAILPWILDVSEGGYPSDAPFYIFSPAMALKIGSQKIKDCSWWKCKELPDGALECWTDQYIMNYEIAGDIYKELGIYGQNIFRIAGNL